MANFRGSSFLALTGCLLPWFRQDRVGGKGGLPAVDTKWFGSGTDEDGLVRFRTLDHLWSLKQKPPSLSRSLPNFGRPLECWMCSSWPRICWTSATDWLLEIGCAVSRGTADAESTSMCALGIR